MLEIPFSTNVILIAAIIAQGIFASVLLLLQRNNSNSNKYLGLLLLTFSLWLLDDFFEAATIYQQDPNYYFLPIYFSFGFGPLIYFYTRSITDVNFKLRKRHLVHFIPVAIQGIGYVFLQCKDYNFRRTFWQEVHLPYTYNLEFIGSLVSLIIYLCLSIIVVKKYQKWINNQFSEISKINLNWLKIILGIISVISFLWIVDTFLRLVQEYYPMHEFSAISMGISILLLAGGSLLQSNLGHAGFEESNSNKISLDKEIEIDKQLLERIKNEMNNQKHYLTPNLTLKTFAKNLDVPSRIISMHLNHGLNKSFLDFVNEYRINEFKFQIDKGQLNHLTLTGIAFECGFNSKSTFNRVFKKVVGQSPSSYQKMSQNRN